jgi:hypothetical protein
LRATSEHDGPAEAAQLRTKHDGPAEAAQLRTTLNSCMPPCKSALYAIRGANGDADDVNLLGDNTDTLNKNTKTLTDASQEVGLEVDVEKTTYMLVSRDQNAGQNRYMN